MEIKRIIREVLWYVIPWLILSCFVYQNRIELNRRRAWIDSVNKYIDDTTQETSEFFELNPGLIKPKSRAIKPERLK